MRETAEPEPTAVRVGNATDTSILAPRSYSEPRRLLYLEDTVANIRLIESIIGRRPSIELIPALLGQLGLELARDLHPDLILLDLPLPDMSGKRVFTELRADEATQAIPVVILSADAAGTLRDELLAGGGVHAYLTKPLEAVRLLEVLDEILDA